MDNQFISSPLLVSPGKYQQYVDPKEQLIRGLQLKNAKLKTELIKIQRSVQARLQTDHQDQQPRKRESLFQSQENLDVLNKELVNTYKRIKMYEYEIGKMEQNSRTINVAQKTTQIDLIIKEKRTMAEKLKAKHLKEKKIVQQNAKKLEGDRKEELDKHVKAITEESKFLKDKVRQLQAKQSSKQLNMKRQYEAIKKIEAHLVEAGLVGGQLDEMRQRAIKSIDINLQRKNKQSRVEQLAKREQSFQTHEEQEIEDRTKDRFKVLLGEIALLQKMQQDYQKQATFAEEQKQEAIRKNLSSRNKLLECENEIQNLQREISFMKSKVIPSNLKPLRPLRSLSSQQSQIHNNEKIISVKGKSSKSILHLLKFDQVGLASEKAQRFTDRNILGKSNLCTKITGMKVYLDRGSNLLAGIQCTYGHKKGGDYVRKDKQAREKQYVEEQFVCKERSFVKTISGSLNEEDKVESISIVCSNGESRKFGSAKSSKKNFYFDIGQEEIPVCVFGALTILKQAGKRQSSALEHLGFQINKQKQDNIHVNQFNQ